MNAFHAADGLAPAQAAIQVRCFYPNGHFVRFSREDINRPIAELFEQQVVKYGDRIAVTSKSQVLTYDELNRMANRVARAVLSRCGETNQPIGLLLDQSGDSIAVMLGLLKAGKIFVPLDATYPRAKLTAILEDCRCELIFSDARNMPIAQELTSGLCPLLCIEELDDAQSAFNIGRSMSADAFAAIFYTSGSSGQPKGVIQTHRNILHRVIIDTNTFHICPEDRLSLLSSATYSVSFRNLFGALLNGAPVCHFGIEQ